VSTLDSSAAVAPPISARSIRLHLRQQRSHAAQTTRSRIARVYEKAIVAAILLGVAAGAVHPLWTAMSAPGLLAPNAPAQLFVFAVLLVILAISIRMLRAAGPLAASAAFRFWLLATPVRRRDLLRPRAVALVAAVTVVLGLVTVPVAHLAATGALLTAAFVVVGTVVAIAAVWAQASEFADRGLHAAGHVFGAGSTLAFGSLATGVGRVSLNSLLGVSSASALPILLSIVAVGMVCAAFAYRGLDRIDLGALGRGQSLWTAARAAASFLDVLLLSEFLAEQRARNTAYARPVGLGPRLRRSRWRLEWTRLRRRPGLLVRVGLAALVWWGCAPVLSGPALIALAVILGYCVVLPMATTLRQLRARPMLRTQFAPHDRALCLASVGVCALTAAVWTAVTLPGLPALAVLVMPVGLTVATYRTVTRAPLDYSMPAVGTPIGDVPVDLIRQLVRGPLLVVALIVGLVMAG
jgi:hypothetical protein